MTPLDDGDACPTCRMRVQPVEVRGVYDGALLLFCRCGYRHRWPDGTDRRARAEAILRKWGVEAVA